MSGGMRWSDEVIARVNQMCEAAGLEAATADVGCLEQLDALVDYVPDLRRACDDLEADNESLRKVADAHTRRAQALESVLLRRNNLLKDAQAAARRDRAEVAWMERHNARLAKWNAGRGQTIKRLNDRIHDLKRELRQAKADRDSASELPGGVEWPRFEDGGLVGIGDDATLHGVPEKVHSITIRASGYSINGWSFPNGKAAMRRQALDSDGRLIVVGDTVYDEDGNECTVAGIVPTAEHGYKVRVEGCDAEDRPFGGTYAPDSLTHEQRDSWERLKKDLQDVCDRGNECSVSYLRGVFLRAKCLAEAGDADA